MNLQNTLDFLVEVEGLKLSPYLDNKGVPTIGIGTVYKPDGTKVTMQDPPITKETAYEWATHRVLNDSSKIIEMCKPYELNDNELTALVSFSYNEGLSAFEDSTLLKVIKA